MGLTGKTSPHSEIALNKTQLERVETSWLVGARKAPQHQGWAKSLSHPSRHQELHEHQRQKRNTDNTMNTTQRHKHDNTMNITQLKATNTKTNSTHTQHHNHHILKKNTHHQHQPTTKRSGNAHPASSCSSNSKPQRNGNATHRQSARALANSQTAHHFE